VPETAKADEMQADRVQADGINARAVVLTMIALLVMLLLAGAGAYAAWRWWGPAGGYDAPNTAPDFSVEKPVLESAPQPARADYMAEKKKLLDSWQWIDRDAGIARIPVEQAMRILAAQGEGKQ